MARSAEKRTVSIFTGKTDDESTAARDGSHPKEEPTMPGARFGRWRPVEGERVWKNRKFGEIVHGPDGRIAKRHGETVGVYSTSYLAAQALEKLGQTR
jgi:hypothetical protein